MTKTVKIDSVLSLANHILAKSTGTTDERRGVCDFLFHILHNSDNYKGFRYLSQNEVPITQLPGIQWGDPETCLSPNFRNTDDTRRCFH